MKRIVCLLIIILSASPLFAATKDVTPRADGDGNMGTVALTWGNGYFDAMTVAGQSVCQENGTDCPSSFGATSLTGLSDVGSPLTHVAGSLLIADGTKYQGVAMTGDVTTTSAGVTAIGTGKVGPTQIASTAVTAGTYSSLAATIDADGRIINAASGSLTGLSDVGSATVTAGRLLIADGTKYQAVAMSNHATIAASGALTLGTGVVGPTELASTAVTPASYTNTNLTVDADGRITTASNGSGSGATSLTGLSDVGSATITAGNILVADGTKYQAVAVTGDVTVTSAGVTAIGTGKVGPTQIASTAVVAGTYGTGSFTVDADGRLTNASAGSLTGLSDVGSATVTAGRILVADGTKYQAVAISGNCQITSAGALSCNRTIGSTLVGATASTNYISVKVANNSTVSGCSCRSIGGTSAQFTLKQCDSAGANCANVTNVAACATTDTSMALSAAGSLTGGNELQQSVGTFSGSPTQIRWNCENQE